MSTLGERGEPFHAEASSSNATGGVALTLYTPDGGTKTLAATERVLVTDVAMVTDTAAELTLVEGASNAAGKRIAWGNVAANGGLVANFLTPHYCVKGNGLKVYASASGNVRVVAKGFILRS